VLKKERPVPPLRPRSCEKSTFRKGESVVGLVWGGLRITVGKSKKKKKPKEERRWGRGKPEPNPTDPQERNGGERADAEPGKKRGGSREGKKKVLRCFSGKDTNLLNFQGQGEEKKRTEGNRRCLQERSLRGRHQAGG